ncbi:MAG: DUF5060 domain-containing protein, partial [Planctomycetota bacterium]
MFVPVLLFAALAAPQQGGGDSVEVAGEPVAGFPLTFTLTGPETLSETSESNPFADYVFTGTFSTPAFDRRIVVPGYFAADGAAGETGADTGDQWRLHYRPEFAGPLNYRLTLVQGDRLLASAEGTIEVQPAPTVDDETRDFRLRGALKPRDGGLTLAPPGTKPAEWTPFYKTGAGSPENLLAYADFDGTWATKSKPRKGESHSVASHKYQPHLQDWTDGDPTWQGGKGKGLIGALNYLAGAGANTIYFIPFNVAGDGRDVWPHRAEPGKEPTDLTRFDCSKLDQWEIVFTHCDRLGIALHVLVTETENEGLFENRTGSGKNYEITGVPFAETRKLYYRELIARFGHHPAVIWNLGEENGRNRKPILRGDARDTTDAQRQAFAAFIKKIDPYDHPVVVHTFPNWQEAIYTPLLGDPNFDGASLQLSPMSQTREQTLRWRARSAAAGRPWFVALDEIGPANAGVLPDAAEGAAENHVQVRRALWANLLSGGAGAE